MSQRRRRHSRSNYRPKILCKFCEKPFHNYMKTLKHEAKDHGHSCNCCERFFVPYEISHGWSVLCFHCAEWLGFCPPMPENLRLKSHDEFGYGDTRLNMHKKDCFKDISEYRYTVYPTTHFPRNWTWNPETLEESLQRIDRQYKLLLEIKHQN